MRDGSHPIDAKVVTPLLVDLLEAGRTGGYPANIKVIYSPGGNRRTNSGRRRRATPLCDLHEAGRPTAPTEGTTGSRATQTDGDARLSLAFASTPLIHQVGRTSRGLRWCHLLLQFLMSVLNRL